MTFLLTGPYGVLGDFNSLAEAESHLEEKTNESVVTDDDFSPRI